MRLTQQTSTVSEFYFVAFFLIVTVKQSSTYLNELFRRNHVITPLGHDLFKIYLVNQFKINLNSMVLFVTTCMQWQCVCLRLWLQLWYRSLQSSLGEYRMKPCCRDSSRFLCHLKCRIISSFLTNTRELQSRQWKCSLPQNRRVSQVDAGNLTVFANPKCSRVFTVESLNFIGKT